MNEATTYRSRSRLMIEALVAAGPRKPIEEYEEGTRELCEDCAGFCSIGDSVIFWLCDGVSDGHSLPKHSSFSGFNNRILAQDLGDGFARAMAHALAKEEGFDREVDLQKDMFGEIAKGWQSRLSDYFAGVQSKEELELLTSLLPRMADGSYRLSWSSTFLGGICYTRERALSLVNIGDSGALVIGEREHKLVPPAEAREMLGATISLGERLEVEVRPLGLGAQWEHCEDVECFLALSDGLSRDLNVLLLTLAEEAKTQPFEHVRRLLLTRGELTYDDQAVIIGRLLPE